MTTPLLDAVRVLPDLLSKAHQADLTMPYDVAVTDHDAKVSLPAVPKHAADLQPWAALLDDARIVEQWPHHNDPRSRDNGWQACLGTYLGVEVVVVGRRYQP